MLIFLFITYGKVTPYDHKENNKKMKQPYDPSAPIQALFKQIDDAQIFNIRTIKLFIIRLISYIRRERFLIL